jgi:hypothetical protein
MYCDAFSPIKGRMKRFDAPVRRHQPIAHAGNVVVQITSASIVMRTNMDPES